MGVRKDGRRSAVLAPHLHRRYEVTHAGTGHQAAPPRPLPLPLHRLAPVVGLVHVLALQAHSAARRAQQASGAGLPPRVPPARGPPHPHPPPTPLPDPRAKGRRAGVRSGTCLEHRVLVVFDSGLGQDALGHIKVAVQRRLGQAGHRQARQHAEQLGRPADGPEGGSAGGGAVGRVAVQT